MCGVGKKVDANEIALERTLMKNRSSTICYTNVLGGIDGRYIPQENLSRQERWRSGR